MILLKNLSTGYHSGKKTIPVSKGIDARLSRGELTSLLGPNGAGKSTLLKTLSGFIPPLDGDVLIDGADVSFYSGRELARKVAVVLTDRPAVTAMDVEEMVALGRSPYTGFSGRLSSVDHAAVEEALLLCGVEDMRKRRVDTLSDGERQKVMIAKALAQDTPVILLDEPSAFLDFPSKVELMLMLRNLARNKGKTILLSTHDLNIALSLSDSLLLVDKNIGYAYGSPSALAADGSLRRFFPNPSISLDTATCQFFVTPTNF